MLGDSVAARKDFEAMLNLNDDAMINFNIIALAGLGRNDEAINYITKLYDLSAETEYNVATAYTLMGMNEEALEHLENAFKKQYYLFFQIAEFNLQMQLNSSL